VTWRSAIRRGRRWKLAFFLVAGFGVAGIAAWLVFGSSLFAVRSVRVLGTTALVPRSEVLAAADIAQGTPLVLVNTAAAAGRIDRITDIQSARVTRDWPDRIVITVLARTPALAVPEPGGFELVDPAGVIVQQVRHRPAGLPEFTPAGPVPGNPALRAAADVVRQLPWWLARRVAEVTVPTPDAVTLHLSGGITVEWGTAGLAAQKARVLTILMRTHARFYDVSAPGAAATS
jgi:cell division protein FtsQ